MRVAIPLFDGVEEMDFVGPFEVFSAAARLGCDIEPLLVAKTESVQCAHGLQVRALAPLAALEDCKLAVVPGGGWLDARGRGVRHAVAEGTIPGLLAAAHARGATIASVCTGAFLLAEGGLLQDRPATTHHSAIEDLRQMGIQIEHARVVDAGDVVTAGGVTSGIDLGLWLIERFFGAASARAVEEYLEYTPTRDIFRVRWPSED